MIRASLESFVETVTSAGVITLADVRRLQREILVDGPENRDEVDTLLGLDRAVAQKHGTWCAFAIQTIVDYVVWTSRPTGYVDHETASWLVASLSAGTGPTPVAEAIAFEVAREAERTDHALLAFVMRSAAGRMSEAAIQPFA
ncbi:hypothetical protein [Enterovirga rhinocerotis]|uniref:Uncharacterized protein n=1 Tax=Enterovirga rhinocerotis TaxID=1339210 RepID=A0A4R7CB13_9HYPH|nr:hypothetical protein [Enterovirga rhinocerotis]TDR93937.1 hypothetical protein EV668_1206 [Enterovirga rhinocerotis]